MKYIVIPIEDAQIVITQDELEHARKSVDGSKVLVHEETLVRKRNKIGLSTLPTEDTGTFEWTYPVYEYKSKELDELLDSPEWTEKTEETVL